MNVTLKLWEQQIGSLRKHWKQTLLFEVMYMTIKIRQKLSNGCFTSVTQKPKCSDNVWQSYLSDWRFSRERQVSGDWTKLQFKSLLCLNGDVQLCTLTCKLFSSYSCRFTTRVGLSYISSSRFCRWSAAARHYPIFLLVHASIDNPLLKRHDTIIMTANPRLRHN